MFITHLVFSLVEIVAFYFYKVSGENIEFNKKTGKPTTSPSTVKSLGMLSIVLGIVVILIGMLTFEEQLCLDKWYVDDKLCKECSV